MKQNATTNSNPAATQLRASDPSSNAWVSANAGTGKTHVLVQRVVRLMVEGVAADRILCLTYTKAAAGEMAERVSATLARLAMASDEDLTLQLAEIGCTSIDGEQMRRARTLLATSIEVPAGMKFLTFHSFCERLLRQFIVEANVPPGFVVIEDSQRDAIVRSELGEITQRCLESRQDDDLTAAYRCCTAAKSDFTDEIKQIASDARFIAYVRGGSIESYWQRLGQLAGIAQPSRAEAELLADWQQQWQHDELFLPQLVDVAKLHGGMQVKETASKHPLPASAQGYARWFESIATTEKGEIKKKIPLVDKAVEKSAPQLAERAIGWWNSCAELVRRGQSVAAMGNSLAFMRVARHLVERVQAAKRAERLLDYSDLISATIGLLESGIGASWVMYKIDGRIDHVLVDEGQDTSPDQWRIVGNLCAEFFAGLSARSEAHRSLFVVGDPKQSIYSFQGARPREFNQQLKHIASRAHAVQQPIDEIDFSVSFRSGQGILSWVDRLFKDSAVAKALVFDRDWVEHVAFNQHLGARIEVWSPPQAQEVQDTAARADPLAPVDQLPPTSAEVQLAQDLADTVSDWLKQPRALAGSGKPIEAGDILILLRQRKPLMPLITSHLRQRGVPVAGIDRIALSEDPAVNDLMSLARFCLLPRDDLSLAEALRSPLFGCSEARLMELASRREKRSLLQVLRGNAEQDCREWLKVLEPLLSLAPRSTPHVFFRRAMVLCDGWRCLTARLGRGRIEALTAFLSEALAASQRAPATLRDFVHWFQTEERELKRQASAETDAVRVLTAHGAKGLEARVVMVVDDQKGVSVNNFPSLMWARLGDGHFLPVWSQGRSEARLAPLGLAQCLADWRTEQGEERMRLLYVALTRAREELYFCPCSTAQGKKQAIDSESWLSLVQQQPLAPDSEMERVFRSQRRVGVRVWTTPARSVAVDASTKHPQQEPAGKYSRSRLRQQSVSLAPAALSPAAGARVINPSQLGRGGKSYAVKGDRSSNRHHLQYGSLVHGIIGHLLKASAQRHQSIAQSHTRWWQKQNGSPLDTATVKQAQEEALSAVRIREIAQLNQQGRWLTEVPVVARTELAGESTIIEGRIDAICLHADSSATLFEFKTGRAPKAGAPMPDYTLRQIQAYLAAARQALPEYHVQGYVVWTKAGRVDNVV